MIFSTDTETIRLAGCVPESSVDGPGMRYVLFFQGCNHGCAGCHNPATHAWNAGDYEDVPVSYLLEHFKENAVTNRVTISGGEPFGQPHALLNLLKGLKELGVSDIWIYTGFTYTELCEVSVYREILGCCDTVVTGRFDITQIKDAPLFAGSANQEIIKLSEQTKHK